VDHRPLELTETLPAYRTASAPTASKCRAPAGGARDRC
jgi:hypothetical protein